MSYLKRDNLSKCFSLLQEFVEESAVVDNKKGTAILALNQLQKVIAGGDVTEDNTDPGCLADRLLIGPRPR
jgi:hypothetical protein